MFGFIKNLLDGVRGMFAINDIKKIVGGDAAISEDMIDNIEMWKAMLTGKSPWSGEAPSLGIEVGICREFADIAINEMDASVDDEQLNGLFTKAIAGLNENLQDGLALGSMAIKPMLGGGVECITADRIIPVVFDDGGNLTDCVFVQRKKVSQNKYLFRTERHMLIPQGLKIENKAWQSPYPGQIGVQVPLSAMEEWAAYPEETTFSGMRDMDFGYYRNPLKNRIDDSPCGVSVYSGVATGRIKSADYQGARIDWEFKSGERAVHVSEKALRRDQKSGKARMAKLDRRLYRGLDIEGNNSELLKEYSPDFRQEDLISGLENYYRQVEFAVGLAYGDLSNAQYVDKTATEIKTAKQRKYNRVTAIQENLKACLEGLVKGIAFYNSMYTRPYNFTCTFNDSILSDEDAERQQDRQDVSMGAMGLAEYRAKWYGEDIETAEANLPEQSGVIMDDMKTAITRTATSEAEVQSKGLNGAQTQSLIAVIGQYTSGQLTEGQAVNLIAAAIGVDKSQARALLNGDINEL